MSYLMGEMLIHLFTAALLGIIVGWLFTRSSYKRKIEDAEVVLLRQLHDVTKQLDITQQQLEKTKESFEQERSRETGNLTELERLQSDLTISKSQADDRKKQTLDLNQSLDEANQKIRLTEEELENQRQKNHKMTRDFDAIKNRLSVFQSDLDEITGQSGVLRSAFEKARLDLVSKDKRIAELESVSSEGLQMAALSVSGNAEPELAISRIARLQTRVQELFDEVNQKNNEIDNLKNSMVVGSNITDLQADDLQQIGGIGDVLEEKLNKMGISRFSDIASWDDSDIDRVDHELDFHGRIRREKWVEQARRLGRSGPSKMSGH